jgi:hypothetical protein
MTRRTRSRCNARRFGSRSLQQQQLMMARNIIIGMTMYQAGFTDSIESIQIFQLKHLNLENEVNLVIIH